VSKGPAGLFSGAYILAHWLERSCQFPRPELSPQRRHLTHPPGVAMNPAAEFCRLFSACGPSQAVLKRSRSKPNPRLRHPVYLDVIPSDLQGLIGPSVTSGGPLGRYC